MRRHNKKGSLELSVNAIVVLVMAIAVLGLGLAFIRGALGKAQTNVFKAIDNAELENPASSEKPATADKNINMKSSGSSELKLGFYNVDQFNVDVSPKLEDPAGGSACVGTGGTGLTAASDLVLSTGTQTVKMGTPTGFQGIIKAKGTATLVPGTYVCTVTFDAVVSAGATGTPTQQTAQFYLTVT